MLIQLLRNSSNYTVPQLIMMIVIMFFALALSFSFHEFMHAFVADWLGDNTPRLYGRVTMNPKAHLDPVGTVLLLLVGFGWGKPVSYNPSNLKRFKSRRLMNIMVSLAGVFGNFIIALLAMIIASVIMMATGFPTVNPVVTCMYYVSQGIAGIGGVPFYGAVFCWLLYYTFLFSLSLMAFNLLPIPPLDGFHVVEFLLPVRITYSDGFRSFMRYGPMILMILIVVGDFGGLDILGTVMTYIEMPALLLINAVSGLIGML